MSIPFLSVVIPTRDTRSLTLACVESVQTVAPAAEVVVVDDGSRDGTAEAVAQRYPTVRLVRNDGSRGFTISANRGLMAARGSILLLLNSDTELLEGSAEALRRCFGENPRLGIAGGSLRYPDGTAQWSGGRAPSLLWFFALASGLPGALARIPGYRKLWPVAGTMPGSEVEWVTGAALAMRRELWEAVGPLDERFRFYGQDLDLCMRAREAGWRVEILTGCRVTHHHGATIGRERGSIGQQHLELLWTDLLRWTRKHRGAFWARSATHSILWGARFRVWLRAVLAPLIPAGQREGWRCDTLSLRSALAAVAEATLDP